jgi:hypothetical protein
METFNARESLNLHRRDFFGAAAVSIAVAQLGVIGSADAQAAESKLPAILPGTQTSFGPLKQIDAGLLNVGYAEAGPAGGPAVCFCTAGRMTFTALLTSRRCWRRPAIGSSSPTCAAMGRRAFCPARQCATASNRQSRSTPSP